MDLSLYSSLTGVTGDDEADRGRLLSSLRYRKNGRCLIDVISWARGLGFYFDVRSKFDPESEDPQECRLESFSLDFGSSSEASSFMSVLRCGPSLPHPLSRATIKGNSVSLYVATDSFLGDNPGFQECEFEEEVA